MKKIIVMLSLMTILNLEGGHSYPKSKTVDHSKDGFEYLSPYMIKAIQFADMKAIENFIQDQRNLTKVDQQYQRTPLMWAVFYRQPNLIPLFLNVNVNQKDRDGCTALMLASERGDHELVKDLLLVPDIDVNEQNDDGNTALMLAILNMLALERKEKISANDIKFSQTIQEILRSRLPVDLNLKNGEGKTALMLAIQKNHTPVIDRLLNTKHLVEMNATDNDGNTALMLAVKNGNEDILNKLLNHRGKTDLALINNDRNNVLMLAAMNGNAEIVAALLPNISPEILNARNNRGMTALMLAVMGGHVAVVRTLLSLPNLRLDLTAKEGTKLESLVNNAPQHSEEISKLMYESKQYKDLKDKQHAQQKAKEDTEKRRTERFYTKAEEIRKQKEAEAQGSRVSSASVAETPEQLRQRALSTASQRGGYSRAGTLGAKASTSPTSRSNGNGTKQN